MSDDKKTDCTPQWDLSSLYESSDDPAFEDDLAAVARASGQFEEKYKGKMNRPDLEPEFLLKAIKDYEAIQELAAGPSSYAALRFSADTADPARGALLQRVREKMTEAMLPLTFFELELCAVSAQTISLLLENRLLAPYRHFISAARRYKKHQLSEVEEKLLERLSNTGSRAFERLFEELLSSLTFDFDGKKLSQTQILSYFYSPDRSVRKKAAASLSEGLASSERTIAYIFNTLMQDKAVADKLRNYAYPEQERHMSNELDKKIVDLVIDVCVEGFPVVFRYYEIKRQLLGLAALDHCDRYAPLDACGKSWTWNEAKGIVLDSFGEFSPLMRDTALEFFDNNWIDAKPRSAKRGGAFCSYVSPGRHPFVFLSFLGNTKDVMTLAHELGHGVHSSLSRCQTPLNFHGTLPLAEVASTFGEMLVFDKLLKSASDREKMSLYADKIEGSFGTIFRQAAMFRFEQDIHRHRREKGELTCADFDGYWQRNMQEMYGKSLILGDEHKSWWTYVSHFVNTPFYVYAYSTAELLSLSLYQRAKAEGEEFTRKYFDLLRAGGSLTPQELMDIVGVRLDDPEFWRGGVKILENEVSEFESLASICG